MGIIYWNQKHEDAVKQWLSASTQQEYTRLFNVLAGGMREMIENIMFKYFSVPDARRVEIREEVLTHVFLNLKYYKPEKQKAYSYLGTMIKYKLHDILVPRNVVFKKTVDLVLLDADFDYVMEEAQPIEYDEREIDFKAITDYFNTHLRDNTTKLKKLQKKEKYKRKRKPWQTSPSIVYLNDVIRICELCIEYLNKYEDINAENLAIYCFENMDIKAYRIEQLFKQEFGIVLGILKRYETDSVFDSRFNMFEDDWCPTDTSIERKRMHRRKIEHKYF